MAAPFLPLLGAAARVLAVRGAASFAAGGISQFLGSRGAGGAVDVAALGRRLGTPNPSQEQIAAAQAEQFRSSVFGATKALVGLAAVGPAAIATGSALKAFGGTVLAQRQELAQYNAGISQAFAKLARQDVMLDVRTGAATSGSTQALADAFMALREDTQPLREAITNIMNTAGLAVVNIARVLTRLASYHPFFLLINVLGRAVEKYLNTGGSEAGIQTILKRQLEELAGIHNIKKEEIKDRDQQPKNKRPRSSFLDDSFLPGP